MEDSLEEYLQHKGQYAVSDYLMKRMVDQWSAQMVPVIVEEGRGIQLYFVSADSNGIPSSRLIRWVELPTPLFDPALIEGQIPAATEVRLDRRELYISHPEVVIQTSRDYLDRDYRVFLWHGQFTDRRSLQVEDLDVRQLLNLADAAVRGREESIMEEVRANKPIK